MPAWTQEFREDIVKRIGEKGVNRPCPRCGADKFTLVDGFAVFGRVDELQDEGVRNLVPSVCVACNRCGYLTFHALGPLGLLPTDQPPPAQDKQIIE
jgi:hypothetical protein